MIWILLLLPLAVAHIRLIYPPARYPFLNYFVDSGKSEKPCGASKDRKG